MKHLKKLFLLIVVLSCTVVYGQNDNLYYAQQYAQAGKYDSALVFVELASVHEETANNPLTWYFRGFIYKELYKAKEDADPRSKLREKALNSCIKSIELDKNNEIKADVLKTVKFLSAKFKNDAASALNNNKDYESGIYNYEMYKKALLMVDSTVNFTKQDIEFYVVLGDVYAGLFEADMEKNKKFFALSKEAYEKALAVDSNDASANYHLARLYYNKALNMIKQTDYDIEMISFENIIDESVNLFKTSLPYMKKAYELDPTNINTLEGLSGIYYSLKDEEQSLKYREQKKKIEEGK